MGGIYYKGVKFGETASSDGSGSAGGALYTKIQDYDPSNVYSAGEYVIYDGDVYVCLNSMVQAAGVWDANLWRSVPISGDVSAFLSVHVVDNVRY